MVNTGSWSLLIAGGSGKIGSTLAGLVRESHPDAELILASRDSGTANAIASELGHARAIALDLNAATLPDLPSVDMVVSCVADPANLLVDYAIDCGIAHIAITPGPGDIAPLVSRCAHRKPLRPIIPLGHYEAGGLMPLVGHLRTRFARIDRVELAALYDSRDPVGATTQNELDADAGPALARVDGRWETITAGRKIATASEDRVNAVPLGTMDVTSAAAMTDARWIRFDVARGRSIGTLENAPASMDLYVDMAGLGYDGVPIALRMLASDPQGQAHFTAFGILMVIEAARRTDRAGFCLPELIIDAGAAVDAMRGVGIRIEELAR